MIYKREISTRVLKVGLREDGIIELIVHEHWNDIETICHAKENNDAIKAISEGRLYPIIAHLADHDIDDEAQRYYAGHERLGVAIALVSTNIMQSALGAMFVGIRKIQTPTQLFHSEVAALSWLKKREHAYHTAMSKLMAS